MTAAQSIFADEPSVREVMPIFLRRVPDYMQKLQSAIESNDHEALAKHCHQFKGSAMSFGFPALSEILCLIEDEARRQASREEIEAVKLPLDNLVREILTHNPLDKGR